MVVSFDVATIIAFAKTCLPIYDGWTNFFSSNYRLNGAIALKLTSWKSCKKNRHVNSIYYESWLQISPRIHRKCGASSLKTRSMQMKHSTVIEMSRIFSFLARFFPFPLQLRLIDQQPVSTWFCVHCAHNHGWEYLWLLGDTFIIMQSGFLLRWLALIWLCNIRNLSKLVYRIGELSTNQQTKKNIEKTSKRDKKHISPSLMVDGEWLTIS